MSDDDLWRDAYARLMTDENVNPLAQILMGPSPVPAWLRQELAELLRPMRPLLIAPFGGKCNFDPESKDAQLALKNADRLVFVRTKATRRKMKTYEKQVATGLAMDRNVSRRGIGPGAQEAKAGSGH